MLNEYGHTSSFGSCRLYIGWHADAGRFPQAFHRQSVMASCSRTNPCICRRKAALQARLARETARIAAAGREGERQEAAWGDATSDEDEAEVARYSRERGQILEVGVSSLPVTKKPDGPARALQACHACLTILEQAGKGKQMWRRRYHPVRSCTQTTGCAGAQHVSIAPALCRRRGRRRCLRTRTRASRRSAR